MSEVSEEITSLAKNIGRVSGANARILAALIGTLIKHNVISQEVIEEEFINGMIRALEPLVLPQGQDVEDAPDDAYEASVSAALALRLMEEIRATLFRPDDEQAG